jgi:SAM-dependent methyltransferase
LLVSSRQVTCDATDCSHRFRVIDGIPILINPRRSVFRETDFDSRAATTFKETGTLAQRIGRILPSPSRDVGRKNNYLRLAAELRAMAPQRRRVLVVGSGDGTASYLAVADVDDTLILETDVSLAGRARIVCDASDMPFEDACFDLVICQAVLEHVLEPQRCVDEMHRVLRAGGVIYATTPFMQQVHMGEFDFTRFTRSGHRWLFRRFAELDSGVATGPASVLVWSFEYFLLSWTSRLWLRRFIKAVTRVALGWMTVLDPVLARRAAALDASGGFYFIGRRSDVETISAREMIGYYAGADSQK